MSRADAPPPQSREVPTDGRHQRTSGRGRPGRTLTGRDNPHMLRRPPADRTARGFTLVEIIIAIAIVAGLSALAWPALQDAVFRSRRADAMSALAAIQQAQERWRANHPTYQSSLADLPGAGSAISPDRHYDLSLVDGTVSATGYTAQATVSKESSQRADSRCQTLQVVVDGGSLVYSSSSSGGANAAPDPCWVR